MNTMKYVVEVTETRKMQMVVEAENDEKALEIASKDYFENISFYDASLDVYDTELTVVHAE